MNEMQNFVMNLQKILGTFDSEVDINKARLLIKELNEFLYTNYDGIGTINGIEYFSNFHKYWEQNHKDILNVQIDEEACELVADALHEIYVLTDGKAFQDIYDTQGLKNEEICKIRFLTANQDFRGSRSFFELVEIYNSDNSIFDEKFIFDFPEDFLKNINITKLSQNDKRVKYAKSIAGFLLEKESSPYVIIEKYDYDVLELKKALIELPHSGYGNKKADMFIRDMVVLGVWKEVKNFNEINVASDVNTIKVALRTGILKTEIPLVSSFLDIFCYQYGYIDDMNAKAWRRVWEIWNKKYENETISSPCLLDYFIYNVVGRQFCKENLYLFEGYNCGHTFKWHSSNNKTCQECYKKGIRNKARLVGKAMPCSNDEGKIVFEKNIFAQTYNIRNCPFSTACNKNGNKNLTPPKSISIWGQTGWTTAYAKRENGGGGLMA